MFHIKNKNIPNANHAAETPDFGGAKNNKEMVINQTLSKTTVAIIIMFQLDNRKGERREI